LTALIAVDAMAAHENRNLHEPGRSDVLGDRVLG
jgi:hypothetical protein